MASRGQSRTTPVVEEVPEPKWVKTTRNAAGVASIMGIIAVSVFAFDYLVPWWQETVESDRRRKEEGTASM